MCTHRHPYHQPLTFTCSLLQNTIRTPLLETTYLLSPLCVWLSRLCCQCPCLITNSIIVPSSVSSLVILFNLSTIKIFTSREVRFHENHFLMLPSSMSFLLLIWATLQAQFLLQFMTQLPLTSLILLALSLLPPQTLLPLLLLHPI